MFGYWVVFDADLFLFVKGFGGIQMTKIFEFFGKIFIRIFVCFAVGKTLALSDNDGVFFDSRFLQCCFLLI